MNRVLEGYENVEACPVCGGEKLEFSKSQTSAPYIVSMVDGIQFITTTVSNFFECKGCGLFIQTPRLDRLHLRNYYSMGVYRNTLGQSQEAMERIEKLRGERLAVYIKEQGVQPKSHLDFGASHGWLLNQVSAEEQYGVDVYGKYLGGYPRIAELVTAVHVLEHCADPLLELRMYRKYCARHLLLEVPKMEDNSFRFPHLFVFPKELIEDMVKSAGFRIVETTQTPDTCIFAEVC